MSARGEAVVDPKLANEHVFGTFPLPPTIPGVNGQRVFSDRKHVNGTVADPIFKMLQRYMGDHVPTKAEVLNECEGLDKDEIEEVRVRCETVFRGHSNGRTNHWAVTRKQLINRRTQKQMS